MATQFNLNQGQRAERKTLITVVEWDEYTLLTSAPSDWSTDYTNYYTKSGNVYTPVTGSSAPEFATNTYYSRADVREILGTRTPDSSIDYNVDVSTETDVRGITYTDVNKTQPSQTFDPYPVLGGSKLGALLNDIRKRNAVSELNQFRVYVITAFAGENGAYEAERHSGCTIYYTSIGGDTNVNFPIVVGMSNSWNETGAPQTGTVNKLTSDFEFTADVTV